MNTKRCVLSLPLSLLLGSFAVAQGQTLTFGVAPGQSTTGTASGGGTGSLGVVIGGYGTVPVSVPPGTSSLGIATALAGALQASGFAATQNGTDVTVTAGPGGTPLTNGGGIGSTDTGVTGIRAKVAPGAPPGFKQNGGAVPKANPAAATNQPGSVQIDAEVRKLIGNVWTVLWIQVVVPIQPGDDGAAVNARAKQMLENAGLKVNSIQLPQVIAPITPIPMMGLDRTFDGGKVQRIDVRFVGGALDLFPSRTVGAGQMPLFGPADFDIGLAADGTETRDFLRWNGNTVLGGGGVVECFLLPNTFGVFVVGLDATMQPWQPFAFPLPFVGLNFYSPFDPLGALLLFDLPGPLGQMQLPLPVPPDPSLFGLQLQFQAMVLDPFAPSLFDNAHRTQGLRVVLGN